MWAILLLGDDHRLLGRKRRPTSETEVKSFFVLATTTRTDDHFATPLNTLFRRPGGTFIQRSFLTRIGALRNQYRRRTGHRAMNKRCGAYSTFIAKAIFYFFPRARIADLPNEPLHDEGKTTLIHSPGHQLTRPLLTLAAFLFLAISLGGCATGPRTGIRKDFEQRQVHTLAVATFYSSDSRFGMADEDFEEVRTLYEAAATATLRDQGFEVIDPRAFQQYLVELQAWELFKDGIRLRRPLTNYFELGSSTSPIPIEILTLRQIARSVPIPVEAVLFGELVYHSQGICRDKTEQSTPYARVKALAGAPEELPRPCVTSHFQAKLVDVQTGQTMWFNRMMVETHARHIDKDIVKDNILRAVLATLNEDSGLAPLAAPKSR